MSRISLILLFLAPISLGMAIGQHQIAEAEMIILGSPLFLQKEAAIVFEDLINCLIQHESGGRTDVYGDRGKAYGVLQFWRETFTRYKTAYGLEDFEYKNPEHQIKLADTMLQADFSNLRHWTTAKFCKRFAKDKH